MTTSVSVNKEASIHFPGIETGFELINICLLFFVAKTLTYREGSLSPLLSQQKKKNNREFMDKSKIKATLKMETMNKLIIIYPVNLVRHYVLNQ